MMATSRYLDQGAKRRHLIAPTVRSGSGCPYDNRGPKGRNDHGGPLDLIYLFHLNHHDLTVAAIE